MLVVDFDDFGSNHIISDQCQSRDCRNELDSLHYANNNFKVTLFAIPGEMTYELLEWCKANSGWVELCAHGFTHRDNWECEKITYEEFDANMKKFQPMFDEYFVKGFKSPGWQSSNDVFEWLHDRNWFVADQSYNDMRRPIGLKAYINNNGQFSANGVPVEAWHGHVWNCVGNGIEETYSHVESLVKAADNFQFVSEVVNG